MLKRIGQRCSKLLFGDDWKIAAAVLIALGAGMPLAATSPLRPGILTVVIAALVLTAFTIGMVIDVRRRP